MSEATPIIRSLMKHTLYAVTHDARGQEVTRTVKGSVVWHQKPCGQTTQQACLRLLLREAIASGGMYIRNGRLTAWKGVDGCKKPGLVVHRLHDGDQVLFERGKFNSLPVRDVVLKDDHSPKSGDLPTTCVLCGGAIQEYKVCAACVKTSSQCYNPEQYLRDH